MARSWRYVKGRADLLHSRGRLAKVMAGTVLVLAAALGTVAGPADVARAVAAGGCAESFLSVSLGPGLPANQQVFVQLCLPAGATPGTVQLLVHGCLYSHQYWEFPDPSAGTSRYSYVASALRAGYATLAFDMIGNGQSSHPPSTEVTVPAGVWVIHQIVQALRGGAISGPGGPVAFSKVIEVSWSFGTFFSWLEVSQYNDVDAAIFTGATHHIAFQFPFLNAVLHLYPADQDPQFAGEYDSGYLTTEPGSRAGIFYDPGSFDPAVPAYDEAHKDLMTQTEFDGFPGALATQLDIKVPVMIALGAEDPLFCSPTATDCSSAAALAAQEAPFLGPNVPGVTGYLLPDSGHALDLMRDASSFFAFAQNWAAATVPPAI
jgi:pimeloyl-ACP methyl ester carboxylesterase